MVSLKLILLLKRIVNDQSIWRQVKRKIKSRTYLQNSSSNIMYEISNVKRLKGLPPSILRFEVLWKVYGARNSSLWLMTNSPAHRKLSVASQDPGCRERHFFGCLILRCDRLSKWNAWTFFFFFLFLRNQAVEALEICAFWSMFVKYFEAYLSTISEMDI